MIYCKPAFSFCKTINSEGPGRGWGTSWDHCWSTLVTKVPQEGQVGTKMALHAAKEGRLETKRGHDGAKVHARGSHGVRMGFPRYYAEDGGSASGG